MRLLCKTTTSFQLLMENTQHIIATKQFSLI